MIELQLFSLPSRRLTGVGARLRFVVTLWWLLVASLRSRGGLIFRVGESNVLQTRSTSHHIITDITCNCNTQLWQAYNTVTVRFYIFKL